MIIGYARVSTDGQTLDAQGQALKDAGAEVLFQEKRSGAKADRKQLARAVDALCPGDVLLVTRLDRLARSTLDLLSLLDTISKRGASFRSLAEGWADTTTATPHHKLMVTLLAGFAEFERSLIHARTSEGRERAKARGVKMGRTPKLTRYQRQEVIKALQEGEVKQVDLAQRFAVSETMISRLAAEVKRGNV